MTDLKILQHQSSQYTSSRLLALPPEMRTMIYEFVLVRPGLISLMDDSGILEPARKYFQILVPEPRLTNLLVLSSLEGQQTNPLRSSGNLLQKQHLSHHCDRL